MIDQFTDTIRAASAAGRKLRIRGGGTKDFYGVALEGDVLDTRGHHGIVDYDPSELVMTVRTGTPVAEIETALAERGQMPSARASPVRAVPLRVPPATSCWACAYSTPPAAISRSADRS